MKKLALVLLSIAAATFTVMANPVNNSTTNVETLEIADGIPFDPSLPFIPGPIEPQGSSDLIDLGLRGNSWDGFYIWIDFNDGDRMSYIELENLITGEKQIVNHPCSGPTIVGVNCIDGLWTLLVKDRKGVRYYAKFSVDSISRRIERWY